MVEGTYEESLPLFHLINGLYCIQKVIHTYLDTYASKFQVIKVIGSIYLPIRWQLPGTWETGRVYLFVLATHRSTP